MLVDISDIKKDLNEEEKEIFDKVIKAMNAKSVREFMNDVYRVFRIISRGL